MFSSKKIFNNINFMRYHNLNFKINNKIWYNNKLDLALYTRQELKFTNYKHHNGHNFMRYGILGVNILVFLGWQVAKENYTFDGILTDYFTQATTERLDIDGTTVRKQNFFPNCFLTSFSHQDAAHLMGNMFFFWMLSKKLHRFLGFKRFMGLYLGGALFGSICSLYSPALSEENVKNVDATRHLNQCMGQKDGFNISLGASDSVMALIAAFYFTFPRHQVYFSKFAYILKLKQLRVSAIWLLPLFFLQDFVSLYNNNYLNNQTNYMAHIGGFIWGTLYYFAICRPLKQQYHIEKSFDVRRVYLMTISLAFYLSIIYTLSVYDLSTKTLEKQAVRFSGKKADEFLLQFQLDVDQNKKLLPQQQEFIKQNNIKFEYNNGIESIKLEDIFKQMEYANICLKKHQESEDQFYNVPNYECDIYFKNLYNFANLLPDQQKQRLISNYQYTLQSDAIKCKQPQEASELIKKTGQFSPDQQKDEKLEAV